MTLASRDLLSGQERGEEVVSWGSEGGLGGKEAGEGSELVTSTLCREL